MKKFPAFLILFIGALFFLIKEKTWPIETNAILKIVKYNKPEFFKCGGYSLKTNFFLPSSAKADGIIMQHYNQKAKIRNCNEMQPATNQISFYEAWRINKDSKITAGRSEGLYLYDDHFFNSEVPQSEGEIKINARVKYFPGLKIPASMKKNSVKLAGNLPASQSQPESWSKVKKYIRHELTVKWNCCKKPFYSNGRAVP